MMMNASNKPVDGSVVRCLELHCSHIYIEKRTKTINPHKGNLGAVESVASLDDNASYSFRVILQQKCWAVCNNSYTAIEHRCAVTNVVSFPSNTREMFFEPRLQRLWRACQRFLPIKKQKYRFKRKYYCIVVVTWSRNRWWRWRHRRACCRKTKTKIRISRSIELNTWKKQTNVHEGDWREVSTWRSIDDATFCASNDVSL